MPISACRLIHGIDANKIDKGPCGTCLAALDASLALLLVKLMKNKEFINAWYSFLDFRNKLKTDIKCLLDNKKALSKVQRSSRGY